MGLRFLKVNKLASKLALALALFGVSYVFVLLILFIVVELPKTRAEVEKDISNVIDTFVQPGAQAVYNLDSETAQTVLLGMKKFRYVVSASIDSEFQTRLAEVSFDRETESTYKFLAGLLDIPNRTTYYRKLHDRRFNKGTHGGLVVDVDIGVALEPAFDKAKSVLFANLFQYILFLLIVYWIVYWLVAKRLSAINLALAEISPESPNRQRVPIYDTNDEVAELARGINGFIESAENYLNAKNEAEKGLLHLTQHLEDVINKRTADLELEKCNAEKARDEADKANQAKSVFLSNMSHELRTPLNAILGFTRRLITKSGAKLDEREMDALLRVLDNGQYLLNLVNDLLDIAKIEANKMQLLLSKVVVSDIVDHCCNKLISLADSKNIKLINQCDSNASIEADKQKIEQVVINLLSNAIKYTHEGWIKVSMTTSQNYIEIIVEDTGVGIKQEDFVKLFDPYNHIHSDSSDVAVVESTGLGLPLVQKIVELHNGTINVSSTPGVGSCFKVRLPYSVSSYNEKELKAS